MSERPKVAGLNAMTGEYVEREMNDEEYAEWLVVRANADKIIEAMTNGH